MRFSFDWYAATPDFSATKTIDHFLAEFSESYLRAGSGRQGYTASERVYSCTHELLATVLHTNFSECHIISTGDEADDVAPFLRSSIRHRLSRVDIAVDFLDGDFSQLYKLGLIAANMAGAKSRLISPPPEVGDDGTGRTLYLGSRSSVGYVRIYEKGRQLRSEQFPNWVRVEYEFKPKNNEARYFYSTASIPELFAATKIGTQIYRLLVNHPGQSKCRASQLGESEGYHATLSHLKKQYSKTLQRLLHDVDFDAQEFVNTLIE